MRIYVPENLLVNAHDLIDHIKLSACTTYAPSYSECTHLQKIRGNRLALKYCINSTFTSACILGLPVEVMSIR
jgi:hypothetical protein